MRTFLTLFFALGMSMASYSQLVISQYVETNSGTAPKGIEVFNNTGSTINFASTPLTVYQGTNGGAFSTPLVTVSSGTLADQAVMVIGTSDMGTYLINNGLSSVLFVTQAFTFNGDDALEIRLGGVRQDTFGSPGSDPGTSWPAPSGGSPSTANQNIQILCSAISAGAPATGWIDPATRFEFVAAATPGTGPGAPGLAGFGIAPSCAPSSCTASIAFNSATCDNVTSGTDTYTSTFDVLIGSEGTLNVTSDFGTPSPSTISADGTITVTGVDEGQAVTVTVSDGAACNIQATSTPANCVPIPPSVQFQTTSSTIGEGDTSIDICVGIANPDSIAASSVDLVFDNLFSSATIVDDFGSSLVFAPAGFFDYVTTLTWAIGDTDPICLTVALVDDIDVEGDETAEFFLDNANSGINLDANGFHSLTITDNDGPQPCPTSPVWEVVTTDNNPAASDGNNGEWTVDGTGFTANGFCGGCTDLVDTWLIYGPLDASAATALNLTFDATEAFGLTDLNVQYSTDYASDPCPSNATWASAAVIADGGPQNVDLLGAAGSSGVFIGIQYNDDGVDGYSDWILDNFVLVSDACPTVGTPVVSTCVVCTTTLAAVDAVCDDNTLGTDTYTATFSFDATTELNNLSVTVTGGTSATTTVTAGTSGTIEVLGTEGTEVTVELTNDLCTLSVTQSSPICVPIPVPSCGAGETSLVFDSFEGTTVASTVNPATYDDGNDIWGIRATLDAITGANEGAEFWGMEDLDNANGGGPFDHELIYDLSFAAGDYTSLNVSFFYYTASFNGTDHLGYKYTSGTASQVVVGQGQLESLDQNTGAWTPVTLSIPLGPDATTAQFILYGFQNGGGQYGGFDDLNICGSTEVACTATLFLNSVSCDANTAGTDTYTATFDFDASFESEDLSISVLPTPASQSMTSIIAGSGPGQFTVSMLETTASFTVTVSNAACSIEQTVSGLTCDPLPELVISEIMYNTSGTDDEWIEICNTGVVDQALVGIEILYNGGLEYAFPVGTPDLLVGECITVALGDNFEAPFNPACEFIPDYSNGSGTNTLGNASGTLALTDGTNTIDEVSYSDSDGADGNDASLHVIDINADNSSTSANWVEIPFGGSPGTNSLTSPCFVPSCLSPIDMDVVEIGFGTSLARVNATWTNPEGTSECEVRGGRISPSSYAAGEPEFADPAQTRTITQTDGSTVLFNIVLYNNSNVPFIIGQRYGYDVRCSCADGSGFSEWSNITAESTFVVPAPPALVDPGSSDKLNRSGIDRMTAFPNPAEEMVNIELVLMEEGTVEILLLNPMGQTVMQILSSGKTSLNQMDLSNLNAGIYMLTVRTASGVVTERLIVN